jgi:hypothetical protein
MADTNVVANAGAGGAKFAVDADALSVNWPYSKLVWGPGGTQTEVDDAANKRIPIKLAEVGSVTVPVSAASLPLPTGAAADATLTGGSAVSIIKSGTKGTSTAALLTSNPIDANTSALHVDGSHVTQPVSGTVTANAGSGTFAVSGTVTANVGTTNGLALDATLTGGTAVALMRGAAKGTTAAANVTSNNIDANTQALHVDGSHVTQPVSGTVSITANSAVNVAQVAGTATDTNSGNKSAGTIRVVLATDQPALTNAQPSNVTQFGGNAVATGTGTGGVGIPRVTVSNDSQVLPTPQTAGGLSFKKLLSAATTNATNVKASAGQIYTIYAFNTNAAVRYLKLYNKASAPTVGTDVPDLTIPIPGNTAGAGVVLDTGGLGVAFGTGIAFATTTGVADNDSAAVAANEVVMTLLYK